MTLFAITDYHWPIYWIICIILFVRLSFPYWLWRRVFPYTWFRLRAHGGCDRSAEDAYSSAAPAPIFAFVRGSCWTELDFVFAFLDYNYILHNVNFTFLYVMKHIGQNSSQCKDVFTNQMVITTVENTKCWLKTSL
jgi:hypothetical protein